MFNSSSKSSLGRILEPLLLSSRLSQCGSFIQHGDTTVLLHCIAVAYFSWKLLRLLRLKYDEKSLIRGALLHDYFLYDWHIPDPSHRLHGFHHAKKALVNADADFSLTPIERDIISHHMFPLNPVPPMTREGIVVCLVDKGCSAYETLFRNTYPQLRPLCEPPETEHLPNP